MRFIGDIHGKITQYRSLISTVNKSVQVGDYGVGFMSEFGRGYIGGSDNPDHRFIRGNHDNLSIAKDRKGFIADGTIEDHVMYIGGALSIDKAMRTEGVSWWADEELTYKQWEGIIQKAVNNKPTVMVTHDCPESIIEWVFPTALPIKSVTQAGLDSIYHQVVPKLWIFGHWHTSKDIMINGTRFICLPELGHIDIDLEEYK